MTVVNADGSRTTAPDPVYGTRVSSGSGIPVPVPCKDQEETVLSLAHDISGGLGDVFSMIREISSVLVGATREDNSPLPPAECLGEELFASRVVLFKIKEKLSELAVKLGIQL